MSHSYILYILYNYIDYILYILTCGKTKTVTRTSYCMDAVVLVTVQVVNVEVAVVARRSTLTVSPASSMKTVPTEELLSWISSRNEVLGILLGVINVWSMSECCIPGLSGI